MGNLINSCNGCNSRYCIDVNHYHNIDVYYCKSCGRIIQILREGDIITEYPDCKKFCRNIKKCRVCRRYCQDMFVFQDDIKRIQTEDNNEDE